MQLDGDVAGDDARAIVDPGCTQDVLGDAQPSPCPHDRRLGATLALLADATVPDVDDAVGDLRGDGIVAHDDRRGTLLGYELGQEREHLAGGVRVEVARGLVGDEELRAIGQRGAERDALLLSARELGRPGVGAVEQPDALEQLPSSNTALALRYARKPERHGDELLRRQLASQRTPVVLVGVPENVLPVAAELTPRRVHEIVPRHHERACRRTGEPGENAHERRLPGATRPEYDARLVLVERQREALERRDAARCRRIDGKQLVSVDDSAHASVSL